MNQKEFEKLATKEKRVWMCKDVLERLAAKKIEEKRLYYLILPSYQEVRNGFMHASYREEGKFLKLMDEIAAQPAQKLFETEVCHVCVKGALMYDWVINFNKYTFSELKDAPALNEVSNIFSNRMLDMMEYLFEGQNVHENEDLPEDPIKPWSIPNVLQNIIDNGGVLVYNGETYGS